MDHAQVQSFHMVSGDDVHAGSVTPRGAAEAQDVQGWTSMSRDLVAFKGGWAEHASRHCIWIVSPAGYTHSRTFDDIAAALSGAFAELGGSAPVVTDPADFGGRTPIVLGAHLLGLQTIPDDAVLFNFEQVDGNSPWFGEHYWTRLAHHPVLDYSRVNRQALVAHGITHAALLPLGYSPALRDVPPTTHKDIDVLFYGSINPRRAQVLDLLESEGVRVSRAFDVYGPARRDMISRARIVLNLHFYDAGIFESARVIYLMSNGIPVVTEAKADDPDLALLRSGVEAVPYLALAPTCQALLADAARLEALGNAAHSTAARYPQVQHLLRLFSAKERNHGQN